MIGDTYKKGHKEEDINRGRHTKGDIHGGGQMEVDIHRTRGDIYKEKYICRKTHKGRYIQKKHIDKDIHKREYTWIGNKQRMTYTKGNTHKRKQIEGNIRRRIYI